MGLVTLKIPYLWGFIDMLSTQQAEDVQMRENQNVLNYGQGEAKHRNYMRLKRGDGQT